MNAPLKPVLEATGIDKAALQLRAINVARGVMPSGHSTITAAVDVQEKLLFWMVVSWAEGFSGHVMAYGTYPEQPQSVFNASAAKRTLPMLHPGGFEATLLAGLDALADELLSRDWKREDGTSQRIEQLLVDANWGRSTHTVREFARRHRHASAILPAHGRSGGPLTRPMNEWRRKPGERMGPGWRMGVIGGQRGINFDADHWKSYLAGRLATAIGDPGSLTFHQGQHEMLAEHLTAERPVSVQARGRTADQWMLSPGKDNHLLDCATMSAVAASVAGIGAAGAEVMTRRRKRVEIPPAGQRRVIQVKRWRA
jgi:phage terminase large subunit GpA-like protein